MADDLETLSKEQLTRLAQYFDEAVTYPTKYKRRRTAFPRSALAPTVRKKPITILEGRPPYSSVARPMGPGTTELALQ